MASNPEDQTSDFQRDDENQGYWVSQREIQARLLALSDIPTYLDDSLRLMSPPPEAGYTLEQARKILHGLGVKHDAKFEDVTMSKGNKLSQPSTSLGDLNSPKAQKEEEDESDYDAEGLKSYKFVPNVVRQPIGGDTDAQGESDADAEGEIDDEMISVPHKIEDMSKKEANHKHEEKTNKSKRKESDGDEGKDGKRDKSRNKQKGQVLAPKSERKQSNGGKRRLEDADLEQDMKNKVKRMKTKEETDGDGKGDQVRGRKSKVFNEVKAGIASQTPSQDASVRGTSTSRISSLLDLPNSRSKVSRPQSALGKSVESMSRPSSSNIHASEYQQEEAASQIASPMQIKFSPSKMHVQAKPPPPPGRDLSKDARWNLQSRNTNRSDTPKQNAGNTEEGKREREMGKLKEKAELLKRWASWMKSEAGRSIMEYKRPHPTSTDVLPTLIFQLSASIHLLQSVDWDFTRHSVLSVDYHGHPDRVTRMHDRAQWEACLKDLDSLFDCIRTWHSVSGSSEQTIQAEVTMLKGFVFALYAICLRKMQDIDIWCYQEFLERSIPLPTILDRALQTQQPIRTDDGGIAFFVFTRAREKVITSYWNRFHNTVNAVALSSNLPTFWAKCDTLSRQEAYREGWPLHAYSPMSGIRSFGLEFVNELAVRWNVILKSEEELHKLYGLPTQPLS